MSITLRVYQKLRYYPWSSAAQLASELEVSPSTVSSILNRAWSRGIVERRSGLGPRGGYGYAIPWGGPSSPRSE